MVGLGPNFCLKFGFGLAKNALFLGSMVNISILSLPLFFPDMFLGFMVGFTLILGSNCLN